MTNTLLIALLVLASLVTALQLFSLFRGANVDFSPLKKFFNSLAESRERGEAGIRQEIAAHKLELSSRLNQARDELNNSVKHFANLLYQHLVPLHKSTEDKIDRITESVDLRLQLAREDIGKSLELARQDALETWKSLREDVNAAQQTSSSVASAVGEMGEMQKTKLDGFASGLGALAESTRTALEAQRATIDERLTQIHEDGATSSQRLREELGDTARGISEAQRTQADALLANLDRLADSSERKLLPSEGLYAEMARRVGLIDAVRREFQVVITGPTTAAALFNGFQMGFKSLANKKRSGGIWSVVGAAKSPFALVAGAIRSLKNSLGPANDGIQPAGPRTGSFGHKLTNVSAVPRALPADEANTNAGANIPADVRPEDPDGQP